MALKNRYVKRAKVSEAEFRLLIRYFVHDLEAKTIASLTGLNRNTVNRYLNSIRVRIAELCEHLSPIGERSSGDYLESDMKNSYDKRTKSGYSKNPVIGLFKCRSKVYAKIVPKWNGARRQDIIHDQMGSPDSISDSSGWHGYIDLVDLGYKKQYRVNHFTNRFTKQKCKIDAIETFWAFAENRLSKFYGIAGSTFYLHLKECEFRFNYRNKDLYKVLLKKFREIPLF